MKVRKRVTLMVVAVSAIFGVSWGTGQLVYVLLYFISDDIGAVLLAISDVMILFNSAVNPFVYALLKQPIQREDQEKAMLFLGGQDSSRDSAHPACGYNHHSTGRGNKSHAVICYIISFNLVFWDKICF